MANLGIHVYEQATAVSIPVVADSGLPYVTGTAPVHMASRPARPNTPVLAASWDEAVEKLGFSYDWEKYPLCEFMYSHFQLFGCQPVIFCNVMDPDTMREDAAQTDHEVHEHIVRLPPEAIASTVRAANGGTALAADEDYSVYYDEKTGACVVELLETGGAYDAEKLSVSYTAVKPDAVVLADIVEGIGHVDDCMTAVGKIPDILCAPGWSHNTAVAAVMATKAAGIMGLFSGKCLIDADCGADGVRDYSQLAGYKNKNNFVDENQHDRPERDGLQVRLHRHLLHRLRHRLFLLRLRLPRHLHRLRLRLSQRVLRVRVRVPRRLLGVRVWVPHQLHRRLLWMRGLRVRMCAGV